MRKAHLDQPSLTSEQFKEQMKRVMAADHGSSASLPSKNNSVVGHEPAETC
jgi:hypothetical protein